MKQPERGKRFDFSIPVDRREVLKGMGLLGSALALGETLSLAEAISPAHEGSTRNVETGGIPRRPLGRTGVEVPILAFGGGHLLDLNGQKPEPDAIRIVHEAIDAGLTFMDNAWDYHNGRCEEVMGKALEGRRQKVFLMTKMCTHGQGKQVGLRQLEESLRRLRTDYLDLLQIHSVVCDDEPDLIFAPGGAIEALAEAKQQGKARFIGFTGHNDPALHLQMLQHDFPFDTCQFPLNAFDWSFRSFEQQLLPELNRRGIAALAMKTICGEGLPIKQRVITAEEALRYALTLPVATVVSGIDSLEILHQNLNIARSFVPMTAAEMQSLRDRVRAHASDGRFEDYKVHKPNSCDRRHG